MNESLQKTGSILQTRRLEANVAFNHGDARPARLVTVSRAGLFIQVVPDNLGNNSGLSVSLPPVSLSLLHMHEGKCLSDAPLGPHSRMCGEM